MLARKRMEGKEGRKQGKDMNDLHQRRKCWDQQHCWWQGSGHCHANISLTWILSCFQGEARKQARLFDLRDKSFYLYPSRRPLFFWRHSKTRKQVVRVHFFFLSSHNVFRALLFLVITSPLKVSGCGYTKRSRRRTMCETWKPSENE